MIVAHAVPVDEYAQAAQEALARLSPEERAEFVRMLQERARTRGVPVPARVGTDPRDLGQVLTDLHQRPGQLRDLLGGPRGGGGGSVPAGGAPAGPPAGAPENPLGSILASPLAKAALAGIAAMVVKRYMRG